MRNSLVSCLGVLLLAGCSAGSPEPRDSKTASPRNLIASVDWQTRTAYVVFEQRDLVAKRWQVGDPTAQEWTVSGPDKKPTSVFVALVSEGMVPAQAAGAGTLRVWKGMRCTGNRPPGWHDTGCIQRGSWSYEVKQNVGYSFCRDSSNPGDLFQEAYVQVGDYIFYRDPNCTTESRRTPYMQWVCFP